MPDPILALANGPAATRPSFGADTARLVRTLLPQAGEGVVGLTGQATPQETGQAWLSWFVGLAPAEAAPLTFTPGELILDPGQIPPAPAGEEEPIPYRPARFAVAAVVVTDDPAARTARTVALAPLEVLLGE